MLSQEYVALRRGAKVSFSVFLFSQKGHAMARRRKYTAGNFLLDCFMIFLTGGLWIVWIFAREMRNH